jgi:hypothetical protein
MIALPASRARWAEGKPAAALSDVTSCNAVKLSYDFAPSPGTLAGIRERGV